MAADDGASADSRGHTRRAILAASAAGAGAGIASALSSSGNPGNLWGGTMALTEAFNVSGDLWIGPDSAKSNVDATDGRVYMASDTQVEYYGDGGAWTKLGVGSSSEPVPSVHTDEATIGGGQNVQFVYSDGTYTEEEIYAAFDALPADREYMGGVVLLGEFTINNHIHPPSYTYINGHNAVLYAGDGLDPGDYIIDMKETRDGTTLGLTQAKQQVEIDGLYINGLGKSNPGGIQTWGDGPGDASASQHFAEYRHRFKHIYIRQIGGFVAFKAGTRRGYYENISVADCNSHGFLAGSGSGDSVFIDVHVEECNGKGIEMNRGFVHWYRPIVQDCTKGILVGKSNNSELREPAIYGGYTEFNDEYGIKILDGVVDPKIRDLLVLSNGQVTTSPGIETAQSGGTLDKVNVRDTGAGQSPAIALTSAAADVNLDPETVEGSISDSGTRTRWQRVIGGGKLGGVDISVTTGQFEGDRSMSSGATANTGDTAYSYWTWDATSSVWTDQDGNTV